VLYYTQGQPESKSLYPCTVTNTDRQILELIQVQYGGTLHSKGKRGVNEKPAFQLVWSGSSKVLALLESVEPFLILKRSQAAIVRQLAEHLRPLKSKGRGIKVEDVEVAYREALKQDIHTLNKRGIN
jgi:hypothetical protein